MSMFSHSSSKGPARRAIAPARRADIRRRVMEYRRVAPNAHLGENSPREDIRSAFFLVRNFWIKYGQLEVALGQLDSRSYSLADC